ncbi:MAG: uroporphyrinogen decarboxylase family protein [bacterium]
MKNFITDLYDNPDQKFCIYSGGANQEVSKKLNVHHWDWTPSVPVTPEPFYGLTHTIPLAMGCEKLFTSEGKEWVSPCINQPEDVKHVRIPDVYEGRTGEILNLIRNMLNEDPQVDIRFPDIQSPLGVAELMWGESFYTSLITNPGEIHELLDKITQFIVSYIKELQNIMGSRYNPSCFPQVWSQAPGYYIADDTNSMVSPEMHREFSVNYINRITEEAGPVYYHSCTWHPQYFENIKSIRNAKIKNWSMIVSCDPAMIIREFSGTTVLAPHIHLDMHNENGIKNIGKNLNSEYDVVKYLLDNMQGNTTLYLQFYDDLVKETDKIISIYRLLDDYRYTPQRHGFK